MAFQDWSRVYTGSYSSTVLNEGCLHQTSHSLQDVTRKWSRFWRESKFAVFCLSVSLSLLPSMLHICVDLPLSLPLYIPTIRQTATENRIMSNSLWLGKGGKSINSVVVLSVCQRRREVLSAWAISLTWAPWVTPVTSPCETRADSQQTARRTLGSRERK